MSHIQFEYEPTKGNINPSERTMKSPQRASNLNSIDFLPQDDKRQLINQKLFYITETDISQIGNEFEIALKRRHNAKKLMNQRS